MISSFKDTEIRKIKVKTFKLKRKQKKFKQFKYIRLQATALNRIRSIDGKFRPNTYKP